MERKMLLLRKNYSQDCTIGELQADGFFFCHTLEPVTRYQHGDPAKKVYGKTSIDSGMYWVTTDYSERFGKIMPHILDVPLFDGVRMHGGNTAADTLGCVLCAANTDGKTKVWQCAETVEKLTAYIQANGNKVLLEVRDTAVA